MLLSDYIEIIRNILSYILRIYTQRYNKIAQEGVFRKRISACDAYV